MTAALALRPDTVALLARVRASASEVSRILDVQEITTPEDETKARALLAVICTLDREADAARKAEKDPHLRAGQAVDQEFKGPRAELARVEALLRRRIAEAAERRDREAQAARAALTAAVVASDHVAANAAALAVSEVEKVAPGGGVAETWTYEAIGVTLADVPREYLMVDMVKVKAEIASALRDGREPAIPGIVFKRTAKLRVGSVRS